MSTDQMTTSISNDDVDIIKESDDIAKKITEILIEGFKSKNNREPSTDEIGEMLETLDEDTINSILNGESNDIDEDDDDEDDGQADQQQQQQQQEEVKVEVTSIDNTKTDNDEVESNVDKKRDLEIVDDNTTTDKKQKLEQGDENVDLSNAVVA